MTTNGKTVDNLPKSVKRAMSKISKRIKARRKRIPVDTSRLRLATKEKEGYRRRWVLDKDDRLSKFGDGGYNFVSSDDFEFEYDDVKNSNGSVNSVVSCSSGGGGKKMYLMEIKEEWYLEDQKKKDQKIKDKENLLKKGTDKHGKVGVDGRYVSDEGISINRNKI
jgi:hypothetical protein